MKRFGIGVSGRLIRQAMAILLAGPDLSLEHTMISGSRTVWLTAGTIIISRRSQHAQILRSVWIRFDRFAAADSAEQAALAVVDGALQSHLWIYDDPALTENDCRDHLMMEALLHLDSSFGSASRVSIARMHNWLAPRKRSSIGIA